MYEAALFLVSQLSGHGREGHLELFTNFNDILGRQEEPVVSILVILRQLEGVAVLDLLRDVPVVRGAPGQPPQAEDLLGRARSVGDSLLFPHLRADAPRQLRQLGSAGGLVVSVTGSTINITRGHWGHFWHKSI